MLKLLGWAKIKRVEALLFSALLLFLPVNLAKHFIFNFCYVDGVLVDYLIPTVYLADILIWGLLGFWLFRCLRSFSTNHLTIQPFSNFSILSFGLLLVSGLSIFGALNQPSAFYKWLKLVEHILFAFYVSKHIDLKKDFFTIVKLMSIGVLFESVLTILQWFKQGSIFGYWFFGENKYTVSTPGIATFDFFGIKKVRSYGTFPHPNALGGYLAIILPWVLHAGLKDVKEVVKEIKGKKFYLLTLGLGLAALFLSFSRSAWVVGILGLLASFPSSILNSSLLNLFKCKVLERSEGFLLMILNSLSFLRRAEFNWIALEMIKDRPFLGVGLNNFTVRMSEYGQVSGWTRFLQPVHNVYLLIAAETGLFGLVLFLCLLFSTFRLILKKKNYLLLISLTQVILLCFVDHYFWTIQQTSLLFWLVLGLAFSSAAVFVVRKIVYNG